MYADSITTSMQDAIDEINRRRRIQEAYNASHSITPQGIKKAIKDITERIKIETAAVAEQQATYNMSALSKEEKARLADSLEKQMKKAARNLEFETAALLRDRIIELRRDMVTDGLPPV
jgi:excinuclease ABC subunit B